MSKEIELFGLRENRPQDCRVHHEIPIAHVDFAYHQSVESCRYALVRKQL